MTTQRKRLKRCCVLLDTPDSEILADLHKLLIDAGRENDGSLSQELQQAALTMRNAGDAFLSAVVQVEDLLEDVEYVPTNSPAGGPIRMDGPGIRTSADIMVQAAKDTIGMALDDDYGNNDPRIQSLRVAMDPLAHALDGWAQGTDNLEFLEEVGES